MLHDLNGPVASDNFHLKRVLSSKRENLNFGHLNVCSLKPSAKHSSLDEVKKIMEGNYLDFLGISETWLKSYISNAAVSIPGYRIFRNDRPNKRGGGVALYVSCKFKAKVLSKSSEPGCEFIFVELMREQVKTVIGVFYLPNGNLSLIEESVSDISSRYSSVVIMGDFNHNLLKQSLHASCMDLCSRLNLGVVHNDRPTHFDVARNSVSLLDFFFVSDPSKLTVSDQFWVPGISHHAFIFLSMDNVPLDANPDIYIRDYAHVNTEAVLCAASQLDFSLFYGTSDVDVQLDIISFYIKHLFNSFVRLKRIRPRCISDVLSSPKIIAAKNLRDLAFAAYCEDNTNVGLRSGVSWDNYKFYRNKVKDEIRKAKREFGEAMFGGSLSTKQLWRKLDHVGASSSDFDSIDVDIDPDSLNTTFASAQSGVSTARNDSFLPDHPEAFGFRNVLPDEVLSAFMHVKSNAVGFDEIPLKFLRILLPQFLCHFVHLFNTIFTTSKFPLAWKLAKIRPIKKKQVGTDPVEYRPISILPALSKVFEVLVKDQITNYIKAKNLLYTNQSGFRKSHSTTSVVLDISERIRENVDKKWASVLLLLDFSKAFDSIDHSLLARKLKEQFLFAGSAVNLIFSYLNGRSQCVCVGSRVSDFLMTTKGVPQGSILGPLLFSLFINDLPSCLKFTVCHLFADDVQLLHSLPVTKISQCVSELNSDLDNIVLWATSNKLLLNPKKSQAMVFSGGRLDASNIDGVLMNGTRIEYLKKVKSLGIILDDMLSWGPHIDCITGKVSFALRKLYNLNFYLPIRIKQILVQSLIMPFFNYGLEIFTGCSLTQMDILLKCFNRAVRYIFSARARDHVSPLVQRFLGSSLSSYISRRLLLFFFKLVRSQSPSYLLPNFQFSRSSRSCQLVLPRINSLLANRSFRVRVARLWNYQMPVKFKNFSCSLHAFKSKLLTVPLR